MNRDPIARALAAIALVGVVAALGAIISLAARTDACAAMPQTLVIGDSLTWRGADKLAALHPDWTIDGVRGRSIWSLQPVLRDHIAAEGMPSTLVIALGTNDGDGTWTRADFYRVLTYVAPSTRVVFVTTYRDPVIYGAAETQRTGRVSSWMRAIAVDRPATSVAYWRGEVIADPSLLIDGVHETDPVGEDVWAGTVSAAWGRA
jgi:hypothetical protein